MGPVALLDAGTVLIIHVPVLFMLALLFGAIWRQAIGGRQAGLWALGHLAFAFNLLLNVSRDILPPWISAGVAFGCGIVGAALLGWGIFVEVGRRYPRWMAFAFLPAVQLAQLYYLLIDPLVGPRVALYGLFMVVSSAVDAVALAADKRPYRRWPNRFTIAMLVTEALVHGSRGLFALLAKPQDFIGPATVANYAFGLQLGASMIGSLGLGIGLIWLCLTEWHRAVQTEVEERRRSEAALAVAKEAAEAAGQAKSRFLASVSHDIRTPMNAIIGLTRLLSRTRLDERQRGQVSRIGTAANTLLELIEGVLDAARIEAGTMTTKSIDFDLGDVLTRVDTIAGVPADQKDLALSVVPARDVPLWLHGDPIRLGQILVNIVSNAVKFTESGEVTLSVAAMGRADDKVELRFVVHDTGPGIASHDLPHIFEPFRQGGEAEANAAGGIGLGLAIAAQLTKLLGGRIAVDSVLGLGSTFTVDLPFRLAARPREAVETATAIRFEGVRLLVADDDDINREVAREILEEAGAVITTAETGAMAVELVTAGSNLFDAVLMDVSMPQLDGVAATRRIRSTYSAERLPIVAVTAHAFDEERERCLAAGMNDFVTKPVEPARLLGVLARCLPARVTLASQGPSPRAIALPKAIPGFDIAGTLGLFCGNASVVERLLGTFSARCAGTGRMIQTALDEGRTDDARALIHGFRGAAATLGAVGLSDLAARLERALKAADRSAIAADLLALSREMESAATALEAHGFR